MALGPCRGFRGGSPGAACECPQGEILYGSRPKPDCPAAHIVGTSVKFCKRAYKLRVIWCGGRDGNGVPRWVCILPVMEDESRT